jgi:membrane-bound serine protease (ClpP class)
MKRRLMLLTLIPFLLALSIGSLVSAQADEPLVVILTGNGPISPAMLEYLSRGIRTAENRDADMLIFQLNTPGGAVVTMNEMVQIIRSSSIPVIVYVSPRGAMAASAGTIITLAGHAAAMAPETMIGAASPISGEGQDLGETAEAKEKNALRATVRSLAERRGSEAIALAEDTIESATAVSASEALEAGLIDFIARDVDELLEILDGYQVSVNDIPMTLETTNATVNELRPTFIEQLLLMLTNPNIVFLLITIGVQAILIELSSPGGWIAGFIGIVSLALATYGLGILPVNWFGLVFLITAFVLFILDIKAPTHGALTAAGIASLIVGALVLFNSPGTPNFLRVSVPLIVIVSLASGGMFFVILMVAVRAQYAPIRTGQESVVGRVGTARSNISPHGSVQLGGELWSADLAEGEEPITAGTRVEILRVEGLRLIVRKIA